MHLINTETLQLETFTSENDTKYIILSHRWQEDEVLYEDMTDLSSCTKLGVNKLKAFCKLAREKGYDHAWVDTCCIDKKSSAELAEAINSMYRYYECTEMCVAYLCDVECYAVDDPEFGKSFRSSVWFTRCWTLQELIAPRVLEFYSSSWGFMSNKLDLLELISDITSIHLEVLDDPSLVASYSVAQRMSWASHRTATRTEDIAYSLMGLFDVNMPTLYGEGPRAFIRLQEEILHYSDDETIFVWVDSNRDSDYTNGLLAKSPADFSICREITATRLHDREQPLTLTNRGIAGSLIMIETSKRSFTFSAILNASIKAPQRSEHFVGLFF